MQLNRRIFGFLLAAGLALAGSNGWAREESSARACVWEIEAQNVPGKVRVAIRLPLGYDAGRAEPYPLLLLLHGAGRNESDLERYGHVIDQAIADGKIPPIVVAMPDARRSFYNDYYDGSENWETFALAELLPSLRARLNVAPGRQGTLVSGYSMGGAGSLQLAFKHPDVFHAVAALEPAIEPALEWKDVVPRDTFYRNKDVYAKRFGDPVDPEYWAANNPATIAHRAPDAISKLGIYIEVGDQDFLYLYRGTEFLHRVLYDNGISHEYRLVRGAEHVGPSLEPRLYEALAFLGRELSPPDWVDAEVIEYHERFDPMEHSAGLNFEERDPAKIRHPELPEHQQDGPPRASDHR